MWTHYKSWLSDTKSWQTIDVSKSSGRIIDLAEYIAERSCTIQLPYTIVQTYKWPTWVALFSRKIVCRIDYPWIISLTYIADISVISPSAHNSTSYSGPLIPALTVAHDWQGSLCNESRKHCHDIKLLMKLLVNFGYNTFCRSFGVPKSPKCWNVKPHPDAMTWSADVISFLESEFHYVILLYSLLTWRPIVGVLVGQQTELMFGELFKFTPWCSRKSEMSYPVRNEL